jgi:hypothetical protein
MNTIDRVMDPMASLNAFANFWAPVRQMQQDSLKMAGRVAHYQHAVVGNYLDWALTWGRAASAGASQLLSQQTELVSKTSEQLRDRGEQIAAITKEAQTMVSKSVKASVPSLSVPASPAA